MGWYDETTDVGVWCRFPFRARSIDFIVTELPQFRPGSHLTQQSRLSRVWSFCRLRLNPTGRPVEHSDTSESCTVAVAACAEGSVLEIRNKTTAMNGCAKITTKTAAG